MEKENINFSIPGAIVLAGIIIAGAIILTNNGGSIIGGFSDDKEVQTASIENFRGITEEDHIRGNPNASITIVEFSDFECPFCGQYHPTLKQLIEENDDVRWVYRHFPLTNIHSNAQSAAIASECIALLGDNDAFWSFSDTLFENQNRLGDALYEETARALGIDMTQFNECLSGEEILADVNADLEEAIESGGRGTPFSIVITPQGEFFPFSGALQYEQVESIINQLRES